MNEIIQAKSFDERMMDKLRDNIGELLTDEELKKIIEKGMAQAFFEPRIQPSGGGWRNDPLPPLAQSAVYEFARQRVNILVAEWFKNNPQVVEKFVQDMLRDGIVNLTLSAIENRLSEPMRKFADDVRQTVINLQQTRTL